MKTLRILFTLTLFVLLAFTLGGCSPASTPAATDTPAPEATTAPATPQLPEGHPAIQSWDAPPPLTIDPNTIYNATFKTEKGDIVVELFADKAPNTVNNFIFLAKQGFYDNTTFHRVLDGFMAQGGDPTGTGTGGPGYTFPDEIDPNMRFDRSGLLAMANAGPNTNGSQFFFTFAPTPWLDGRHTIFGEVISGQDVLSQLTLRDPQENPDFAGDTLYTVEISEVTVSKLPTATPEPTPFAPDPTATERFMSKMDPAERVGYWNTAPTTTLDDDTIYFATFKTEVGDIKVELRPDLAPQNVANFVALANAGYYDDTRFYQVLQDLVAVGGDPLNNGSGNPGYTMPSELNSDVFNATGWLGSAQQGASGAGQFFFTLSEAPWLAERFTPIGEVIEGLDVLQNFVIVDPTAPTGEPGTLLKSVEISTGDKSLLPEPTPTPTPFAPTLPPEGQRPLDDVEPAERNAYYNTAPAMQIDTTKDYIAILRTDVGDITIDLFEKQTPITVNNFVILALNGFYDNTTFHRVIADFMVQGGDPAGSGAGTPGYEFADEIVNDLRFDRAGLLAMANRGFDTNGAQFFITLAETPWLNDRHTIFGEVIDGTDALQAIQLRDPETATEPGTTLIRVDIETR